MGIILFFIEQKTLNEESQNKAYQLQQKEIEIQKNYINRFRASATRSSQAKSREKQLKKISKIEALVSKSKSPAFNFPDCPRSGKLVLNIKNLSHSFEDKILFLDINLKISVQEKKNNFHYMFQIFLYLQKLFFYIICLKNIYHD